MSERYLRIVERTDSLPEAWTFVMACLEEMREPKIEITPVWQSTDGFRDCVYDVVVQGEPTAP